MTSPAFRTVGVIGSGIMGAGIAQTCAQSGHRVILFDLELALAINARESIERTLSTLVAKGKLSEKEKEHALGRIEITEKLESVRADIIIEAVVERLSTKQDIFRILESVNDESVVLVSNTSSLSINAIGASMKYQNRFAGLHFFNPAPVMKLVEIVKGEFTSSETVEGLQLFCAALNKQAVVVRDSPGFIVNRVARLFYVEALKMAEQNVTDYATIDRLIRGVGFKMGPFELMDLIGIDTNLAVTKSIYHAFGNNPKFAPSRIQQQKVDNGHLGRKTRKGFFDYPE